MADQLPTTFKVPSDDPSGLMMQNLFGPGWDTISDHSTPYAAATMAYNILDSFNILALTAVSVLFLFSFIAGSVGTANEGTPLGRRFSATWMPLRFSLTLGALAPVVKGLSIFQAFMLMTIGYSINVANYVWGHGVEFFVEHAGTLTMQAPESLLDDSQALGDGILHSLTMQAYLRDRLDLNVPGAPYKDKYIATGQDGTGSYYITFNVPGEFSEGELGRIKIPCNDENDGSCIGRYNAVVTLISDLMSLAGNLADLSGDLKTLEPDSSATLARAVKAYQQQVLPHLDLAATQANQDLQDRLGDFGKVAKSNGWVTAGSYYWNISQLNEKGAQAVYTNITYMPFNFKAIAARSMEDIITVNARYAAYIEDAYSLERFAVSGTSTSSLFSDEPGNKLSTDYWKWKINGVIGRPVMRMMLNNLDKSNEKWIPGAGSGTTDPMALMSSVGNTLVTGTEAAIVLTTAAVVAADATDGAASSGGLQFVPLIGNAAKATSAGGRAFVREISEWIRTISMILLPYGFYLAYMLPAFPMVLWIIAVCGWLILVMESLVAAPLWVAAHALPDGEGFAGNHARQGYMLFLGVFLRPPLMVFGFLIAMTLLNGLGLVIGVIFSAFVFDFLSDTVLGISATLAYLVVLGSVITMAAYKFFGLITHLPDRVTNWIGQQLHSLGEGYEASKVSHHFSSTGGVSSQTGNAALAGLRAGGSSAGAGSGAGNESNGVTAAGSGPGNADYNADRQGKLAFKGGALLGRKFGGQGSGADSVGNAQGTTRPPTNPSDHA